MSFYSSKNIPFWYLFNIVNNNKVDVERALNKIGGTLMATNNYHWTSTQGSSEYAWMLKWFDGHVFNSSKNYNDYVRAFYPLP